MDEALAAATRLFWQGYDRTSLADLTGALGIAPASFYFAFGSKEALFRQVVERYLAERMTAFEAAFQAATPRAAVEALLRDYVDVVTDPGHVPGCLVVNSAPAAGAADPLRDWLAAHRTALQSRLQDRFAADRAGNGLPAGTEPAALARLVAVLAGGLAVEARSGATRRQLRQAVAVAVRVFPG